MANTFVHPASTRGHTDIGWLNGFHSFSFGRFHEPSRQAFGALKVLNDDTVQPGTGFGTHPHANMEIISIPLSGVISHQDSTGNEATIQTGEVQVMSAGTGIYHSEYNRDRQNLLKFLQIWISPDKEDVEPRYQQVRVNTGQRNGFTQLVSPYPEDEGLWIHQRAWLHLGNFDAGSGATYALKQPGNGVYLFLLEGTVEVAGKVLNARDAIEVWDTDQVEIAVQDKASIVLIEVPMH